MDKNDRAFPDILAVDPVGCGCTECIIGEYVNEDIWTSRATAADLAAVLSGEVGNNTSSSLFRLVLTNYFSEKSANDFVELLQEELELELPRINTDNILDNVW